MHGGKEMRLLPTAGGSGPRSMDGRGGWTLKYLGCIYFCLNLPSSLTSFFKTPLTPKGKKASGWQAKWNAFSYTFSSQKGCCNILVSRLHTNKQDSNIVNSSQRLVSSLKTTSFRFKILISKIMYTYFYYLNLNSKI